MCEKTRRGRVLWRHTFRRSLCSASTWRCFEGIPVLILDPFGTCCDLIATNERARADSYSLSDVLGKHSGWRTSEAKDLPLCIVSLFVDHFNMIEASAEWVDVLCYSPQTVMRKAKNKLSQTQIRAIGLNSVWYANWSSLRYKQLG